MGAAGCSAPAGNDSAQAADGAKAVRVTTVRESDVAQQYTLTGVTRAASRARLAFQTSGRLAERPVNIGTELAKGDLIARLDQPELGPAAEAARADARRLSTQLAQAERDLNRVQRLVAQDAATQQELENTRARRDSLSAQLASARAQRERAANAADELRLTAPIAGSVSQVFFEPGEFVTAGQAVVALSGAQSLEVAIGVPERLVGAIDTGDAATLTLPFFDDRAVQGTITRVSRAADGPGELFQAVISLPANADLRPGISVNWQVDAPVEPGLKVPSSAVASPGVSHAPRVYVVRDGRAHAVAVTLGEIVGEDVIVRGTLEAGERVVTAGLNNLADGRGVRVLDDAASAGPTDEASGG